MKRFLALCLTLALVLATGCSQKTESPDAPAPTGGGNSAQAGQDHPAEGDTVTITYLSRFVNPELVRAGYYIEKLEEFRAENPNIIIEDISIGDDSEAFKAKINSGVASGDLPDLFIANNGFPLDQWVASGIVQDLSDLVGAEDWDGPSGAMLDAFQFNGQPGVYGVPNALNTAQVFVNTALLKEHGFDVPATWEDVEEIANTLNGEGIVPFGVAAKSKAEVGRFISALSVMMYGTQFRDDLAAKGLNWDDPKCVALIEKFRHFIDAKVLDPDAVSFDVPDVISLFEQGQIAMVYAAAYHFDRFQEMAFSDDIVCVNFPSFESNPEYKDIWIASASEGFMISSPKGTPEYDAACKLLKFMLSADTFQGFAERNGGGAFPVDFAFDSSKAKHVVGSFMELFAQRTDSTDEFTAYLNDASLVDATRTEFQSLFVGRSVDEVSKTLTELYAKQGW